MFFLGACHLCSLTHASYRALLTLFSLQSKNVTLKRRLSNASFESNSKFRRTEKEDAPAFIVEEANTHTSITQSDLNTSSSSDGVAISTPKATTSSQSEVVTSSPEDVAISPPTGATRSRSQSEENTSSSADVPITLPDNVSISQFKDATLSQTGPSSHEDVTMREESTESSEVSHATSTKDTSDNQEDATSRAEHAEDITASLAQNIDPIEAADDFIISAKDVSAPLSPKYECADDEMDFSGLCFR